MMGRIAVIFLLVGMLIAAAGMYYLQVYYYYREIPADQAPSVLSIVTPQGSVDLPVTDYTAIHSISTPIGNRACFKTDPALAAQGEPYANATPIAAPGWFDCFDYGELTTDIEAGTAKAYLVQKNVVPKIDSVLAVYPDGRAVEWRQQNEDAEEKRTID